MNHHPTPLRTAVTAALLVAGAALFSTAHAQNHGNNSGGNRGGGGMHNDGGHGNNGHGGFHGNDGHGNNAFHNDGHGGVPPHMHMDGRFSHNHPYYDHGHQFHGMPHGGYEIHHRGGSYWYDRGHWYRHRNGVAIVIAAPIGAFVPFLPFAYSTVWWGGVPYYYANDTYYTWDDAQDEYEVVDPPSGIESGGTTDAPPGDDIFIYPRNGQSTEQQARDRYECHRSAVDQTGYDPTVSGGGVSASDAANKRANYMRAQAACLDARGYSVK